MVDSLSSLCPLSPPSIPTLGNYLLRPTLNGWTARLWKAVLPPRSKVIAKAPLGIIG